MSEAIAAIYILFVVGASLAIYFRFIDKHLDRMLDKAFEGWHKPIDEIEVE